ncbi:hypothetical protein Q0F99_00650 [Rathayibacter oskolensis]|nr:hypothetical protein [Rathayibacter oskolensis]WKK71756.1 hypothetical protein Q0F99_00650 [Rathayibacter oskolensis]
MPLVASQLQLGETETLVVPEMPDGWSASAAELRSDGGSTTGTSAC